MLLEKADVQGYLTTEDLMEFYPDVSKDAEHIEAVVVALRRHGVDIYDGENESEFTDTESVEEPAEYGSFSNLENISSDDTIGLYLKEMSRVPLLSMEEEMEIARRIEMGRNSKKSWTTPTVIPLPTGGSFWRAKLKKVPWRVSI